jgi:hypothetical protein
MNTNLVTVIKRIIAEEGEDIFANPARLKGYVADYSRLLEKRTGATPDRQAK